MKKIISVIMAAVLALTCAVTVFAADPDWVNELNSKFTDAVGPEVDGLAIDYVQYVPSGLEENTKYPLLILIHGMGQGGYEREQLENNYFSAFAGDEMQAKFNNGAAFIFIPRSDESKSEFHTWGDDEVEPLYAAIQQFIAENKDYIDLTRIYIGGYSMGGKMTLKMLTSYPDMFAAAFPMCPAYIMSDEQYEAVADIPMWVMCSRFDILAGYYVYGRDIWAGICAGTNIPSDCRMSVFGKVCYPDGTKTSSNHHVWFAASNNMFTYDGGDYPNMTTTDANGNTVTLTYPDGLVEWLNSYTSDYAGETLTPTTLVADNTSTVLDMAGRMLRSILYMFADTVNSFFTSK